MDGVGLRVNDGVDAVNEVMARLMDLGENPAELQDELGGQLLVAWQDRYDAEQAPDGSQWDKSIRAKAEGGSTLKDKGDLFDSLNYQVGDGYVDLGTDNAVYAAIHNYGGTIKAKSADHLAFKIGNRWSKKKQVTILERRFVGFSDDDVALVDDVINGFLAEVMAV